MHGLQTWVALPQAHESDPPGFAHHAAATLPVVELPGARLVVVAGHGFGARSPVAVLVDTLYVSIDLKAGAELVIPAEHIERALYPVAGDLVLDTLALPLEQMAVLEAGTAPVLRARSASRVMLLGGAPLDGHRHLWWNFVASSRERIEQAKADWQAGRFAPVPGETEFIPLPER
jgi:redox-sensitive bicupin YhaK (pirin superfamily)